MKKFGLVLAGMLLVVGEMQNALAQELLNWRTNTVIDAKTKRRITSVSVSGLNGDETITSNGESCSVSNNQGLNGGLCCIDNSNLSKIACESSSSGAGCPSGFEQDEEGRCGDQCDESMLSKVVVKVDAPDPKSSFASYIIQSNCDILGGTLDAATLTCTINACTPGTKIGPEGALLAAPSVGNQIFIKWDGPCGAGTGGTKTYCEARCPKNGKKEIFTASYNRKDPPPSQTPEPTPTIISCICKPKNRDNSYCAPQAEVCRSRNDNRGEQVNCDTRNRACDPPPPTPTPPPPRTPTPPPPRTPTPPPPRTPTPQPTRSPSPRPTGTVSRTPTATPSSAMVCNPPYMWCPDGTCQRSCP